jgi:hypothetical protein
MDRLSRNPFESAVLSCAADTPLCVERSGSGSDVFVAAGMPGRCVVQTTVAMAATRISVYARVERQLDSSENVR